MQKLERSPCGAFGGHVNRGLALQGIQAASGQHCCADSHGQDSVGMLG